MDFVKENKRTFTYLVGLGLILLLIFVYFYRTNTKEYVSETFLMDTYVSIKTYGPDTDLMKQAVSEAFSEMRRIAELTDRFPEEGTIEYTISEVCKINSMAGKEPVLVSEDVFRILLLAKEYNELSQGAFDITIAPVLDVWGFGRDKMQVPNESDIKQVLKLVDIDNLVINSKEKSAFLKYKGASVDLGGIAKGYAAERAADVLKKYGIKQAIINAGGNVRVLGLKEKVSPWKIGIQDPRDASNLIAILHLEDESAVTAGDYQRYFTTDGVRYHHIISPWTGFPANNHLSVTVVCKDAGVADVLATALFILEPKEAFNLAESLAGIDAVLVSSDKKIRVTSGLRTKIEVKPGEEYIYDEGR